MKKLSGVVAMVAGASRGAGRGIAIVLGQAGATVYCTGRSAAIEETAEMVSERGGRGIGVRLDHTKSAEVAKLFDRVKRDEGRLSVLVNNVNADALYETKASWNVAPEASLEIFKTSIWSHLVNVQHAIPLMSANRKGLIVEITDGDGFYYRGNLHYDLTKSTAIRLAMDFAAELRKKKIASVAVTPGFLRSEKVLRSLRVTEANWRDAVKRRPEFAESETPFFVGRAITALAADPHVMRMSGRVFHTLELAKQYGFTDVDGRMPDVWGFLATRFRYRKIDDDFYSYFDIDLEAMNRELKKIRREIRRAERHPEPHRRRRISNADAPSA